LGAIETATEGVGNLGTGGSTLGIAAIASVLAAGGYLFKRRRDSS
jgi:LPXTG-motif cell wall-anchored protein